MKKVNALNIDIAENNLAPGRLPSRSLQ